MVSRAKKKGNILAQEIGDEDLLSRLSDELIHKVLSFVDAKVAVQTSALSRRWKFIWTTLPFLNFGWYGNSTHKNISEFIRHVLSNRDHESHLSELKFCVHNNAVIKDLVDKFVEYAISHNEQSLTLDLLDDHKPYKLSTFSSKSLEKLTLRVNLQECALESDCWDLPALTTLHLWSPGYSKKDKFSGSWIKDLWFTCLPSLRTLCLRDWILSDSSFSFSLPAITTLHLSKCVSPMTSVWNFPTVTSMQLDYVYIPDNLGDIFSALINLQNLALFLSPDQQDHIISCPPQVLNLTIRTSFCHYAFICQSIVVSAPKLCNFTSFGIFAAAIGVPELENVNIRLNGWFQGLILADREQYHQWLTYMLSGLGNAKNLTFDSEIIEALNDISNLLVSLPSPFCKLQYVKLPRGFKESSISSALRSYLLGGSPKATIVKELPQHTIPLSVAVSITDQHVALQEPLAAPINELVDTQYVNQSLSVDTVNRYVQEEHSVEDTMVDADRVRHDIDSLVERIDKDQVSSLRGGRDSGLWRRHEVNSEFVCLLDRIMQKYQETFEHFTTKNKKLCSMNLNVLCTSLNDFIKISITDVDCEMIAAYRDVFSYFQNQGLDMSWVVNHLNYIEHLRFSKPLVNELHSIDCHIEDAKTKLQELQAQVNNVKIKLQDLETRVDDAKYKLQDLQTLRTEKLTEIEKAFGTMGTNIAVGFVGDDLLPNS
ncbi:putative F-box/LRR-repeat protein At3g59160 [Apium graveolens]|uniref:putative F-box/LRR-repeat protein At3g59160 n=1 Tax=Apium graveolens TaxID=4045 RepID=UPI003D799599